MKNTIKFLTVLLVVFSFSSCGDDIEALADITLESSIEGKYNVDFKAESDENISESMTLSLTGNKDISAYISKLKKVKINKITYEITKFTGDEYVDMNVGLYLYEEKENKIIVAPRNYNLNSESSVVYEITDTTILNTISTELLNSKQIRLLLKGDYQSMSSAMAELTVTVFFDATANPL